MFLHFRPPALFLFFLADVCTFLFSLPFLFLFSLAPVGLLFFLFPLFFSFAKTHTQKNKNLIQKREEKDPHLFSSHRGFIIFYFVFHLVFLIFFSLGFQLLPVSTSSFAPLPLFVFVFFLVLVCSRFLLFVQLSFVVVTPAVPAVTSVSSVPGF